MCTSCRIPPGRLLLAILLLALALAGRPAAARSAAADDCLALAKRVERAERIPAGLVQAVALAESGRYLRAARQRLAWPWTVASGADSFYLPDKPSAIAKVEELQARGRTNIDVGCMQINLRYHPAAFASLDEAFDPIANVAYGAGFLKRLRDETRSWSRATARYHSGDRARGDAYRARVFHVWQNLRAGRPGARASPFWERVSRPRPPVQAALLAGAAPAPKRAAVRLPAVRGLWAGEGSLWSGAPGRLWRPLPGAIAPPAGQ
jgi:hypothetical protein